MTLKENESICGEPVVIDKRALQAGLKKVRRRRWCLWSIILLYIPMMYIAMKTLPSFSKVMYVFFVWFILMFSIALVAALARCPSCGNYFHLNGMTLLYLRKCLHCQLHVCADKKLA
jgi:hypothetical protein